LDRSVTIDNHKRPGSVGLAVKSISDAVKDRSAGVACSSKEQLVEAVSHHGHGGWLSHRRIQLE
jgi:hypothetical protein